MSLEDKKQRQDLVDQIMNVFMSLVPSNYVSQVVGPLYTVKFQAIAEVIAEFQVEAQKVFKDSGYDYLRAEFIYQVLGALLFPQRPGSRYPEIEGDITFREFLSRIVGLLLQGATLDSVQEGLQILTDEQLQVVESRIKQGAVWREEFGRYEYEYTDRVEDVFSFEISLPGFGKDPFKLAGNVETVLEALRPAHTIYKYRHLFEEAFGHVFDDGEVSWDLRGYYYDDFRKYCCGVESITGGQGETLEDRFLFRDVSRNFESVQPGVFITIQSGPNAKGARENSGSGGQFGIYQESQRSQYGVYQVREVLAFPVGDDDNARPYITTPSGLRGKAVVRDGAFLDVSQDWGQAIEGEILEMFSGPNAGIYRLDTVLGNSGGKLGYVQGGLQGCVVRPAKSLLRVDRRMPFEATNQEYSVGVDRMGVKTPIQTEQEEVNSYSIVSL